MLMRRNVAAGIGSDEQGEYCIERLCSDLDRKEPRYKSPTLLYFIAGNIHGTDGRTNGDQCYHRVYFRQTWPIESK